MFFTKHAKILDLAFEIVPKLKFQHISIAKTQVSAYVHCQNTSFSIILNAESSVLAGIVSFPQRERKGLLNVCIFDISKIMPNLLFQHLYFDLYFVYCIEKMPKHDIWHMFHFCQDWMNSDLQPSSDLNKCKKWCFGSWCADVCNYRGLFWIPKLLFWRVDWNIWGPKLQFRHCKHMFTYAKTMVQAPNIEDDCIKTIVLASIYRL